MIVSLACDEQNINTRLWYRYASFLSLDAAEEETVIRRAHATAAGAWDIPEAVAAFECDGIT